MQEAQTPKPRLSLKSTNPKDSIGIRKPRCYHVTSGHVRRLVSLAMMEGAMKYGAFNYRVAGVRASVYYDATNEHLDSYWEGESTDPDSGLMHVIKAIASLSVLADAIIQGKCEDDRPPNFVNLAEFKVEQQKIVDSFFEKYPNPEKGYTQVEINRQMQDSGGVDSEFAGKDNTAYIKELVMRKLGPGTEKIADAVAKGLIPKDGAEELPPEHKADPERDNGHMPPKYVPAPYTPGPRQAYVPKKPRNPDADMTKGEGQNLQKLAHTPPGRCSSNDAMSNAIHSEDFQITGSAAGEVERASNPVPEGMTPKD